MENLKDKVCLVYDCGTFLSFAQRLGREFGKVLYYTPWNQQSYPSSNDYLIGEGMPGIERVDSFWQHVEEVDLICFFDVYQGDLQEHLIKMGKNVWGARYGEDLELDRVGLKEVMKELGLPVNEYIELEGTDALREYLMQNDDVYVKVSRFRGDFESFKSPSYKIVEPLLTKLEHQLGAKKRIEMFIVEKKVDAVCEGGIDLYTVDGQYPKIISYGYEIKNCGFAATVQPFDKTSPLLTGFFEKMAPVFKEYKYRGDFSSESRITKDKESFMIDSTCRKPSPPSELLQEMISNWGEIMYWGAQGKMIEPVYESKYGIEVIIKAGEDMSQDWQPIYYPKELERWVKLKNATKIKGTTFIIPQDYSLHEVGALCAIGDSMEECIKKVEEYADKIDGYFEINCNSIMDKLEEQIKNGTDVGIKF